MRKSDLELKLRSENIPPDMYSLNGGLPNEAYCLGFSEGKWEVYYSERGTKSGLLKFNEEDEACEYFFKLIKNEFLR